MNNSSSYGIVTSYGCTLNNCTARANGGSSSFSAGISVAGASTVTACTAAFNTSSNGNLIGSTGMGIAAGSGSTVRNCTVQGNKGDGIQAAANSQISGNTCDGNGAGNGSGAGVHVTGQANRIEANNVTNNTRGIEASTAAIRNFIVRNTARTNTNNYVIVAGNRIAQIVVPTANSADIANANSGSSDGFTNVDPWANFSY
jgi:parallel beta-helix repeat protein